MKVPPKSRKKKRRKNTPELDEEEVPNGGRALERVRQQAEARGLAPPEIEGLMLEDDTLDVEGTPGEEDSEKKPQKKPRRKTSRKGSKSRQSSKESK